MGAHLKFRRAPLAEMVVELRWASKWSPQNSLISGTPAPPTIMIAVGNSEERLFSEFGQHIAAYDFVISERLVPPGMPLLPYQPTYRFRRKDIALPVLFHIGPGIFSAHAIPPYKTWHEFSTVVWDGISALRDAGASAVQTADATDHAPIFPHTIMMRYIDVFSGDLLNGLSPSQFISKILGFRVEVPAAMQQYSNSLRNRAVQVGITISSDIELVITAAESMRNGEPTVLMDWLATSTSAPANEPFDPSTVMDKLNRAHDSISTLFVDFTEPIRDLMEPIEEESSHAD